MGKVSLHTQLVGMLKNRLFLTAVLAEHPAIHDVQIERPIAICGLPRTGTTHLHNLMSSDPALRSLPYWESLEPVLSPTERAAAASGAVDPRPTRCAAGLEMLHLALPHFPRMHEMTVDHVHEEIQLLAVAGSTMLFETMAPVPGWRDWYLAHDQTPFYEELRTYLKVLQWLRPGRRPTRWVLKSPQHLEQLGPLLHTFPDATFVMTHRDPVSVTTSMLTMLVYTSRLQVERVDPQAQGKYWANRLQQMLSTCVRDRDLLPDVSTTDVLFDEFMADDLGVVRRIYDLAGQPWSGEAETSMAAFMHDHPRGKFGGLVYDLADFGLAADERRAALRFYADRFKTRDE